ncbi:MAG: hypothetical protein K5664_04385 [Firmicutes bacterium]|nr:hypothetical protein [Bacillota bacterium]
MKIYKFPEEYEKISQEYKVSCNGEKIGVYSCDVSAVPFNQVWSGYQRPENQTEKSAYIMLSSDEAITLEIEPKRCFEKITVRPLSKKIKPNIENGKVSVLFSEAGQYTVEFDDFHNVLTVFINPEKDFQDIRNDENVIYFGAGVHYVDKRIILKDGQIVFIDEGAVVYGAIEAVDKKDIKIIGYGILDNSHMNRANEINGCAVLDPDAGDMTGNPIFLNRCQNILIEGVTLVNSSGWNIYLDGCSDVTVDNIKVIGQWRYNADGCDFCNCRNSVIKNSFLRTFDDCIVIKGFKLNNNLPLENITAENCVLWCDWGRALEVGAETSAPYMMEITFKNCDIIYGCHVMLDIQHGDKAKISNVRFEDMRIEYRAKAEYPLIQENKDSVYENKDETYMPTLFEIIAGTTMWSIDNCSGTLSDVSFKNISVTTEDGRIPQNSSIFARDNENKIDGVYFENITVNGKRCDMRTLKVHIGTGAENIYFNDIRR